MPSRASVEAQAQTPAKAGCQNYKNVSNGTQPVLNVFIKRVNTLDGSLNSLKGVWTSTNSHFDLSLFSIYIYQHNLFARSINTSGSMEAVYQLQAVAYVK